MSMIEKLNGMLNGDLGRLYSIISDCGSLLSLLENVSVVNDTVPLYEFSKSSKHLAVKNLTSFFLIFIMAFLFFFG
jgi:hypothetical protein